MSTTHEYNFKAHTPYDGQQWYNIIKSAAGHVTNEVPEASAPNSPTATKTSRDSSLNTALAEQQAAEKEKAHLQTQGITGGENVASPTEATPTSATGATHPNAETAAVAPGVAVHDTAVHPVEKV